MNPEIDKLEAEAKDLEDRLDEIRSRLYTLYSQEPPSEEALARRKEWGGLTPEQAHQKMRTSIYEALYKPNPGMIRALLGQVESE